ncbi:GtrA family protein [Sphingosinicella sp. BN140058]|uniref:GtrA family protein n=1 Tax=Sphingosinicella sp. BN140058 TaxID=1892855 RepID=UPI00101153C9|nr:GtrA family protein [Sphingosinicella sp. BN140058]QAY78866.1 GtrA family protein [Sphingosinicella sp. BN140058]
MKSSTTPLAAQLIRYGIVGGLSSILYSGVYLWLAGLLPPSWATAAVPPAFLAAAAFGFVLHGRWSFAGNRSGTSGSAVRFLLVQAGGMLLNAAFTWTITGPMHGPVWLPLLPCVLVTPLLTFGIHRRWVFGHSQ